MCISRVYEGDDGEAHWLYSSDSQMPANTSCVHHTGTCRHVTACPSCHHACGHQHPAYHSRPVSTHSSAAGLAKALPTAVEKGAPAKSGQASVDEQQPELPVRENNSTAVEDSPASDSGASSVTCDLDYYVVEYVLKSQMHRVKDIEQEFGVTIQSINRVCDEIVTVAFQRYNPTIQVENEEKARRSFLALYEVVYRRIIQRTVQAKVKPPLTPNDILSAISSAYKEQIFVSVDSDGLFTLVGPFEQVATVESFILKRNATQDLGHHSAHDDEKFQQEDETEEFQSETERGRDEVEPKSPVSVFEVGGRLIVKVCTADITRSSLDVIVNAANEHLQNHAGVAGAIENAGGDELRQDCEAIVQQGGPLKV